MTDTQVRIAGRFRLEQQLGAGAFGEAHLAVDEQTGKRVVIKRMLGKHDGQPELVERFRREVRALERLHHECIPAAVASGEDDGKPWYAVEFCEGKDLLKTAKDDPFPWPLQRVAPLMQDLLGALGAAHAAGIVHRDLKPANLIIVNKAGRERAMLIDFGIAKHLAGGSLTRQDLTQGAVVGTPFYLSPEQAEGETVDPRSDLYTTGAILYEMLTGRRPAQGNTATSIITSILKDPPPRLRAVLPDAPEPLEQLILELMAKKRDERPRTAAEVAARLAQVEAPDAELAATGKLTAPTHADREPGDPVGKDPYLGRTIAGKYELRDLLGKGGFGAVYRAWHIELKMDVAIKLLLMPSDSPTVVPGTKADVPDRFRREARAMRAFVHKHAVQVRDFGRDGGLVYLEMDYLRGRTLEAVIHQEKKVGEDQLLPLAGQALSALAEAHKKGIIHRDLKPANVMIVKEGEQEEVRLLDFGIAKLVGALEEEGAARTGQGMVIGTAEYMSPEQAGGDEIGPQTDVYSMGVVLYQALSGVLPIDGGKEPTQASMRARIMTKPPRPLNEVAPHVSDRTAAAVMRALEKDPAKRPKDAQELAEELLGGTPWLLSIGSTTFHTGIGRGPPPTTITPPSPPPRRGPGAVIGAVVAAVVVGGGAVLLARPDLRQRTLGMLGLAAVTEAPLVTERPATEPGTGTRPATERATESSTGTRPATETATGTRPATEPPATEPSTGTRPATETPATETSTGTRPATETPASVPAWWNAVPEASRPALPLPEGLTFGSEAATYVNAKDGSVLVFVPAGECTVGEDRRQTHVSPFFLGKHEVRVEQLAAMGMKVEQPAWATSNHPAVNVTWDEATAYCEKAGLRLPTEAEWERAARGAGSAPYPWGTEEPGAGGRWRANVSGKDDGHEHGAPTGSFPAGLSPVACLDLTGNAAEWVQDSVDVQGEARRVVKGGSWKTSAQPTWKQQRFLPTYRGEAVGFRVARAAR